MSGAVLMSLGPFRFSVIPVGYQKLENELTTKWTAMKNVGVYDRWQWLGPEAQVTRIDGVIYPIEFGGHRTIQGMKQSAAQGEVHMLVAASGTVFGPHAIKSIKLLDSHIAPGGIPRKEEYSLELIYMDEGLSLGGLFGRSFMKGILSIF